MFSVLKSYFLRLILEPNRQKAFIIDYFTINVFKKPLILANPFGNTAASFRVNFVIFGDSTAIFFRWSFYDISVEKVMKTLLIIAANDIHLCFRLISSLNLKVIPISGHFQIL